MTKEEKVEQQRFENEKKLLHLKFQSESGLAAAKGIFIFNGAAITALLTYWGSLRNSVGASNTTLLTAGIFFSLGIIAAVLCSGAGNFWHRFMVEGEEDSAKFNQTGTYGLFSLSLFFAVVGCIFMFWSLVYSHK